MLRLMIFLVCVSVSCAAFGQEPVTGDELLERYFLTETARIEASNLSDIETKADWLEQRPELHRQLREMLGLDPWPEKSPLEITYTGTVDHPEFVVKNLHYQSLPGLYVTGNLYVPKELEEKAPAILYVCGHARVRKDGVSYGNKTAYHHHGAWFARNGYVCLTIDTIQLGEISGRHHGTYRYGEWWWNARGYTPAGVECWNGMRGLDVLTSLPEVDAERIGITGRSGGGAYSWWVAALDERVKVAVPVAGITSMRNHVVDDCVEGHCDCMFMVNTYRWDFANVAALLAPRPLLISNTDKDRIFPLDGVVDVHAKARRIYELLGAGDKLGLQITEGPHKDTQVLRVHAFQWFNRYLKQDEELIETPAVKFFEPEELKVFDELPDDEIVTKVDESFVSQAAISLPSDEAEWERWREQWLAELKAKSFGGWPSDDKAPQMTKTETKVADGLRYRSWSFESQAHVPLTLFLVHNDAVETGELDLIVLNVVDEENWSETAALLSPMIGAAEAENEQFTKELQQTKQMLQSFKWGMAYLAPRGIGPTAWTADERERTHIRRRFALLGQTLDGMRVWDIRRGIQLLQQAEDTKDVPLWLQASGVMAGNAVYASLFEENIARMDLHDLPESHRTGPIYLNVLKTLDMPQAVALAAERTPVRIYDQDAVKWSYPVEVGKLLGWDEKRVRIRGAE